MAEKMLITQALDERDLLVKKIFDKIGKGNFVDTIKPNEDKTYETRETRETFAQKAESAFQQINDLIDRYQRIDAAIVASNAATKIQTSYGEFTIAGAISMRSRLKGNGIYDGSADFEAQLERKLLNSLNSGLAFANDKNKQLQSTAENMRLSILGKDAKVKDEKPLAVVEAYIKENTTELVDPLDVRKKIEEIRDKRTALLSELDTQIKVSNATTFIEF